MQDQMSRTAEAIFFHISGLIFDNDGRLPGVADTVVSVCDFGRTVTPIITPSELGAALGLNEDETWDAIDDFNDFGTLSLNERGPYLEMVYTGPMYGRSMAE